MTSLRPSFFSKWAAQRRIARLPEIQLARQANYYMTNTSPNPDWTATIATSAGMLEMSLEQHEEALRRTIDGSAALLDQRAHETPSRRGAGGRPRAR